MAPHFFFLNASFKENKEVRCEEENILSMEICSQVVKIIQ